jgi:hypothetical protein
MQLRRKAQLYGHVIKCGVNLNKSGNRMALGMAAPPSYGDRAFWDTRFLTETRFEWLGAGGPLVAHIQEYLEMAAKTDGSPLPKTLHIGPGTSVLHEHILHIYQHLYPSVDEIAVVNTDYSAEAVTKGGRTMRQDVAGPTSAWETSDALSWVDVRDLAQKYGTAMRYRVMKTSRLDMRTDQMQRQRFTHSSSTSTRPLTPSNCLPSILRLL